MSRASTLLFAAALTSAAFAQNWTVNEPVDVLFYVQTFYGGCTPGVDYSYAIPDCPTTGVQYVAKITAMDPPTGSLDILPGVTGAVLNDVFVFDGPMTRYMTLAPGTTSAEIQFRAVGTPAQEGDIHVCGQSEFWISNLGICPEGLSPIINESCVVHGGSTGITEAPLEPVIQWPCPFNGQRLSINLPAMETATVDIIDASGRRSLSRNIGYSGVLDLSALPDGAYVMDLVRSNGSVITRRFLVARQ